MITSAKNPKIHWLHSLQTSSKARREEALFVVEGVRLAEEALQAGWRARLVLYSGDLRPRGQAVVAGFAAQGAPVEEAAPAALRAASDTETPQGLLVAIEWRPLPLPERLDFVLVADAVRDPGNLGTLLRTAAAAGAQALLLPPETADAFAPKVLRAGMGAHFRLPVQGLDWDALAARLAGLQVFLAAAGEAQSRPCYAANFRQPLALIVGGEAEGAGLPAQRLAGQRVSIPMPGGGESLNVAVAAGILLFEVVRQRQGYKNLSGPDQT